MGKNMGKGGKNRKRGANKDEEAVKRELVLKEEGQEYGLITKVLGNGHLEVLLVTGAKAIGHIRGAIRRKIWITLHSVVLVSLRDFEADKVDILSLYSNEEVKQMIKNNILPSSMFSGETNNNQSSGLDFVSNENVKESKEDEEADTETAEGATKKLDIDAI